MMTGDPIVTPDGNYVIAAAANEVYCTIPDPSGYTAWYYWHYTFPAGTEAGTPAFTASGALYIAAEGVLYKLSAPGKLLWKTPELAGVLHDPAVAPDGSIYLLMGNHLFAFSSGGENLWMSDMVDSLSGIGAPAIAGDGNIYISTDKGSVHAFTPAGWEPYTAYSDPSAQFVSPPTIDGDGNLFLLTYDGRVVSLTKKLFLRWSYNLGSVASPCGLALGNDGTLYVGGTSKLVAFR
jgi:outer membrane protein assembly factor BamB